MAAGHSGGSWKVAYADFVTAMMAFFLVMWIGAQDQKVKQSVANYFVDPSGVSKRPVRTGAVMDSPSYGSLPKEEGIAMSRGRDAYSAPGDRPSPATKRVGEWIRADDATLRYWKEQARQCREKAARALDVVAKTAKAEAVALAELTSRLQAWFASEVIARAQGLQREMLVVSQEEVNWREIAEDLLAA